MYTEQNEIEKTLFSYNYKTKMDIILCLNVYAVRSKNNGLQFKKNRMNLHQITYTV